MHRGFAFRIKRSMLRLIHEGWTLREAEIDAHLLLCESLLFIGSDGIPPEPQSRRIRKLSRRVKRAYLRVALRITFH